MKIKLATNENALGPSRNAIHAAQEALKEAHHYPDGNQFDLKNALSDFLAVKPEQLTIGNGSEHILEFIVKSYLQKNESAVISQYVFHTIPMLIQRSGAHMIEVPAKEWGHDISAMIRAIDSNTRIVFLVNPNNPTGTYTNADDFHRLIKSVPSNILIVVDEAYLEYVTHPNYPNTLSYLSAHPNLILIRTFSKAYGLAALRLGYAVSSSEVATILNHARLPFHVSSIAQKAGCAALHDQLHILNTASMNKAGMQQIEEGLKALGIAYIPSTANFIAIDVGDATLAYEKLLQMGIMVRSLQSYGMPRHIRVTIGMADEMEYFLRAMKEIQNG